jgi:hypothetical protein
MSGEMDFDAGSTGAASTHLRDVRAKDGIHLTHLKKASEPPAPRCRFCPGHEFRRSRFRARDALRLLLLRYPVRCLRCRQRQTITVFAAARAESWKVRIERTPEPTDSWPIFTLDRRPEFIAAPQPLVAIPVAASASTPVRPPEPLQPRWRPIPVPPPPSRAADVAPRWDGDENAIW